MTRDPQPSSPADSLPQALTDLLCAHPDCAEALDRISAEIGKLTAQMAGAELLLKIRDAILCAEEMCLAELTDARSKAQQLHDVMRKAAELAREDFTPNAEAPGSALH